MAGFALATLANLIALGVAFFGSAKTACTTYYVVAYGAWLFLLILDLSLRPTIGSARFEGWDPAEVDAFRSYFVALVFPGAARNYGFLLAGLRLAAPVWGVVALTQSRWLTAGALLAHWFVVGPLWVRLRGPAVLAQSAHKSPAIAEELEAVRGAHARYRAMVMPPSERDVRGPR